jgi:prepilin-type N-terminal cleavage/methylation domain-containing protein
VKGMRNLRSSARGFSLVELLLVLTIILVIAAIAIPNYLSAMQRAREARTQRHSSRPKWYATRTRRDTARSRWHATGTRRYATRSGWRTTQWWRHSDRHDNRWDDIQRFDRAIPLHLSPEPSLGARVAVYRRTAARPDQWEILLQRQLECDPLRPGHYSDGIEPTNLSLPRQRSDQLPAEKILARPAGRGRRLPIRPFHPVSHTS